MPNTKEQMIKKDKLKLSKHWLYFLLCRDYPIICVNLLRGVE